MTTTTAQDLRSRIANMSDEPPKPWIPENVGDFIAGTVVDIGSRTTAYSPDCYVITVETAEGELRTIWAMGAVLERDLPNKNFRVGDQLAIRRLRDGTDKQKRPFKMFAVLKESAHDAARNDAPPLDETQALVDENDASEDDASEDDASESFPFGANVDVTRRR